MRILRFICFLIVLFLLAGVFVPYISVMAQEPVMPTLSLNVTLSEDKIRFNKPVQGSISVINTTDTGVENAAIRIQKPDSIGLFLPDCSTVVTTDTLQIAEMKPNSVKTWELCYKLLTEKAHAGTYNLIYKLTYRLGEKTALVTAEKTIEIDLIGVTSVLGIPLAFAGFVLPGLMMLLILKMFKVSWAEKLTGEDRIIISIFISLLLLGPLTYFASRPAAKDWLQRFNLNEEISIDRLVSYVIIGLVLGLMVSLAYYLINKQKRDLAISIYDSNKKVIKKALLLNPKKFKETMVFQNKKDNYRIIGAHFISTETKYLVLPKFRLNAASIADEGIRKSVINFLTEKGYYNDPPSEVCDDPNNILCIIGLIEEDRGNSVVIVQPVVKIIAETMEEVPFRNFKFYEINKDEFFATLEDREMYLLEIVG